MTGESYKYWAFISYSHKDNVAVRDRVGERCIRWADWLHEQLETYRVPGAYREQSICTGEPMPERFFPAFRDEADLPANHDLSSQIKDALLQSRFLIVIASPRSARSHYVNEEVRYFRELGRANRIFSLIIDGEPYVRLRPREGWSAEEDCFCPALVQEMHDDGRLNDDVATPEEPIAADVRVRTATRYSEMRLAGSATSDGRSLLEFMKLKLLAGVMGVGLDELVQRDKVRQLEAARARSRVLRRWLAAVIVLAVLSVAAGLFAMLQRNVATREQQKAVTAREEAEQMLRFMMDDLRASLSGTGQTSVLARIDAKIGEYLHKHPSGEDDWGRKSLAAALLMNRSRQAESTGDKKAAVSIAREALAAREAILRAQPESIVSKLAVAETLAHLANLISTDQASEDEALADFRRAEELAKPYAENPDGDDQALLTLIDVSAGSSFVLGNRRQTDEALAAALLNVSRAEKRVERSPENHKPLVYLAAALGRVSNFQQQLNKRKEALDAVIRQEQVQGKIWGLTHMEADLEPWAEANANVAEILMTLGENSLAKEAIIRADKQIRGSISYDPDNASAQMHASRIWNMHAALSLIEGKYKEGESYAREALDAAEKCLAADADSVMAKVQCASACMSLSSALAFQSDPDANEYDHEAFNFLRELWQDPRLFFELKLNFVNVAIREAKRVRDGSNKGDAAARAILSEAKQALGTIPAGPKYDAFVTKLTAALKELSDSIPE